MINVFRVIQWPPKLDGHFEFNKLFILVCLNGISQAMFENTESELRELNTNVESLERNFMELQELKWVLHYTDLFFTQV